MSDKTLPMAITGAVAVVGLGMAAIAFFVHQATTDLNNVHADLLQLKQEVAAVDQLKSEAHGLNARINELDAGMLAMAKMLNLDGAELMRLMKDNLNGVAHEEVPAVQVAPALEMKAAMPRPVEEPAEDVDANGETPAWARAAESSATESKAISKPAFSMSDIDGILIKRISENWNMPGGDIADMRTELRLRLTREGAMKAVDVIKSSGDSAFDDSAVSAIMRIGVIPEVALLSDEIYRQGYENRSIVFTPDLGTY